MSQDPNTLVERVRNLTPRQMDMLAHILDAIESAPAEPAPDSQNRSFTDFAFCGMWADREDMKDSIQWVRNLRETE